MSLENALSSAISGVQVNQKNLYLTSTNVAHANDKDYHRLQSELGSDRLGHVEVKRIKMVMDEFLERERVEQHTKVGYSSIKDYFLEQISNAFGSPEQFKENSIPKNISTAVENFFNKMNMLATTPESNSLKTSVVNSADYLINNLNYLASKMYGLRIHADSMIEQSCHSINQSLEEIYKINLELAHVKSHDEQQAFLEANRNQALYKISEYIDIVTYYDENSMVHVYTADGHVMVGDFLSEFQHKSLPNLDSVIEEHDFNPLLLQSRNEITELDFNKIKSGKLKGLIEIRDIDVPQVLSELNELARNVYSEINQIYSTGNHISGHQELISQGGDISEIKFNGEVRFTLLHKDGSPVIDQDSYFIRPLKLALQGKNLHEIAEEINQHYKFGNNQVRISDHIDDVRLLPQSDIGENFKFNLEFDNAQSDSEIAIQQVSVLYGKNQHQTLYKHGLDSLINAHSYETVSTTKTIEVDLRNLPSAIQDFTVRIKVNVNGSYAAIDYVINRVELKKYYAATEIQGDNSKIIQPNMRQYIESEFKDGIFKINADDKFRFAIEDLNSTSTYGNFFYALKCNNLFTEKSKLGGEALNIQLENKIKQRSSMLNIAGVAYGKKGLPSIGLANNEILHKMLLLQSKSVKFLESKNTFYQFSALVIENTSSKLQSAKNINDRELSFQRILDEEKQKISSVNVDEEIAKTILIKNLHHASTKLVKLVEDMFEELLGIV